MTAFRRTKWNFALDRAVEWARECAKPLVILEALRCDYPWASDRFHRLVMDGMLEKIKRLSSSAVLYHPYVEPRVGAGKGLLAAAASRACVVVTDDFPGFFHPRMIQSAARQLPVRLEAVDSNGLLPLRAATRAFTTAYSFRRFLQKSLPAHLANFPKRDPLASLKLAPLKSLPKAITEKWPPTSAANLSDPIFLARLPINHQVGAVSIRGGEAAATKALRKFLRYRLDEYFIERNQPEKDATSNLSPYMHFGHISTHQIFHELMKREKWSEAKIALRASGSRSGWWGLEESAEGFLDQLITWRELGFQEASYHSGYDRFESLPEWARKTLAKHARDERSHTYTLEEFAAAGTHDPLWNAAQRQLVCEGRIHNYLRMLWGKKILEWSGSPEESLKIMIELNNRYALDGRDPNSYSGISWCLGRYDHPWGPERPIFGTVRYMTSKNTARKVHVKAYLRKYAD
jgi:deoxyribodipyrimidine photo-lyase